MHFSVYTCIYLLRQCILKLLPFKDRRNWHEIIHACAGPKRKLLTSLVTVKKYFVFGKMYQYSIEENVFLTKYFIYVTRDLSKYSRSGPVPLKIGQSYLQACYKHNCHVWTNMFSGRSPNVHENLTRDSKEALKHPLCQNNNVGEASTSTQVSAQSNHSIVCTE